MYVELVSCSFRSFWCTSHRQHLSNMIPFLVALGIYLLGFSLLTYACIFADASTSPLAKLLTTQLPNILFLRPLKYWFGEQTLHQILLFLSEWTQVILYQFLVTASWSVVFSFVYPEISISSTVSSWPHKVLGVVVCLACMESWRLVFHSSPGYITQKTLHRYDHVRIVQILLLFIFRTWQSFESLISHSRLSFISYLS